MENILSSLGYKLNERKLGDLRALFSEDYRALD
jgi:hypothetical protein